MVDALGLGSLFALVPAAWNGLFRVAGGADVRIVVSPVLI
jgi:hypothetical protein